MCHSATEYAKAKIFFLKQSQETLSLNDLKSRLLSDIGSANCNFSNDKKESGPQVANPQVAAFEEGLLV